MPGICPRCDKNVYFAEEKQAIGKSWHKLCFVCAIYRKMLDSGSISEHDDEMFCNSCYRRQFGPKGYGYGVGAGSLSMDDGKGYTTSRNKTDYQAAAYVAPRKMALAEQTNTIHKLKNNNNTLYKGVSNYNNKYNVYNNNYNGFVRKTSNVPTGQMAAKRRTPKWGGAEICPRCDKAVFIAELMRGGGSAYHKTCFTCYSCSKRLDSATLCEHENEIYCKSCYGRHFGPKGFGYGIGAGTLQMS